MSGTRYNAGKPKLSLVLEARHALEGCAAVLEYGMTKYSRGNWRKGLKYTEVCDSLARHLTKFLAGEDLDIGPKGEINKDFSGLPHPYMILCNALFLAELLTTHEEMDDRSREHLQKTLDSIQAIVDLCDKKPEQKS